MDPKSYYELIKKLVDAIGFLMVTVGKQPPAYAEEVKGAIMKAVTGKK